MNGFSRFARLRMLVPAIALLAASACDTTASLQQLRNAQVDGDGYNTHLARLYHAYAETEMAAYDWWTSKYFADKGLMAAYGTLVAPEDPTTWQVPPAMLAELLGARELLLSMLTEENRTNFPMEAATAMAAYDCWVEQLDDGWKTDRIDTCRTEFEKAMRAMQTPREPISPPQKPMPAAAPEVTSSILYFPFDAETLEQTGVNVLNKLIDYLSSAPNTDIVIHGHADRAGRDDYNMLLSEKRAKFVKSELVGAGIESPRIEYFAFGESDPKIPTADGVAEPANRRVEIFLE